MDLQYILLGHDHTSTSTVLALSRDLSDAELDREFDLGLRTLRRTLVHLIGNIEVWSALMAGELPTRHPAEPAPSIDVLKERFEAAHAHFRQVAEWVQRTDRSNTAFVDVLDDPPRHKSLGAGIAHLITHSMLHRSEALHILQRLGVPNLPEGDVLSWENVIRRVMNLEMDSPDDDGWK